MKLEDALRIGAANLAAAGLEDSRREARRVLAGVLSLDEAGVLAGGARELSAEEQEACLIALAKREAGQPLSRILGQREFWSLDFVVTPAVLDPRPDSETLIETALGDIADRDAPLRLLDLGTGSGCLLLSLLSELPAATGLGVDVSEPALAVAWRNAQRLGLSQRVRVKRSDWTEGVEGRFDIVLCNPPYVSEADYRALDRSVADFDPRLALVPGPIWEEGYEATGLEAYEAIVPRLAEVLTEGGSAYLEIGWDQADSVASIARDSGFAAPVVTRDLAGHPRCITLRRQPRLQPLGPS